jgi:hypothetical protein
MKVLYVFVVILFLVLGFFIGFFVKDFSLTGEVVRGFDEYSYTRAICSNGECIDVVVSCAGGDVVGIEPVFYLVEQEDGWEDPRDENFSGFCS